MITIIARINPINWDTGRRIPVIPLETMNVGLVVCHYCRDLHEESITASLRPYPIVAVHYTNLNEDYFFVGDTKCRCSSALSEGPLYFLGKA